MAGARELAAKIKAGLVEADNEFHIGIALMTRVSWGLMIITAICLAMALILWQLPWAIAGFVVGAGNLVLMFRTEKALQRHQCIRG